MANYQVVRGRVEAQNDKGIKLNGGWHNYSRWADTLEECSTGDQVEIQLDSKGFVRSLKKLAPSPRQTQPSKTSETRGVSAEWIRVQALTLAIEYARYRAEDQYTLRDLYELADELEGAILHGFPIEPISGILEQIPE